MYEKGVAIFKYPHVRDIWLAYLQQFAKRYGGTKLERARDLFKQALRDVRCPSSFMHDAQSSAAVCCSSVHLHLMILNHMGHVAICLTSAQGAVYSTTRGTVVAICTHTSCLSCAEVPFTPLQAPPEESKPLFLQYAGLEEQYGLARSAMEVYDKAVKTVPVKERLSVYELYLARAHEYFGLGKVYILMRFSNISASCAFITASTFCSVQGQHLCWQCHLTQGSSYCVDITLTAISMESF